MGLRGQAWQQCRNEINDKYEVFHGLYGKWMDAAKDATVAAGLPNFAERNKLPVYHKGAGIIQGLTLLGYATSYDMAVQSLQNQMEQTCPDHFLAGVKLILDDLLADHVSPIQLNNLLSEEAELGKEWAHA